MKRCLETKKNLIDSSKNNSIMNPVNVIKMNEPREPELITGKSYLKQTVETDTNIIKENKLTILNHICSPRKEQIQAQETPHSTRGSNKTLRLSRSSIYTSTMCVQQ